MTYRELQTFIQVASFYLEEHKKENKFSYALKKAIKLNQSVWEKFTELNTDIDIECCAVNKDGIMLRGSRGELEFTKQGIRARNEARKKLYESEADVKTYFTNDIPEDLTDSELEAFTGFVIAESQLKIVENQ